MIFTADAPGPLTFWYGSVSPVPLTIGSGPNPDLSPDSALLQQKGTFTSFFKDKKSKRSHKRVKVKVFLTKFA